MSRAAAWPARRRVLRCLGLLAAAGAGACGGGGDLSGVGTGGTGHGAGTTPGGATLTGGGTGDPAVGGQPGAGLPGPVADGTAAPLPATQNATVIGPVTGFGSVYVAGIRFDLGGAQLGSEDRPLSGEAELRLGMVVQVQGAIAQGGLTGTAGRLRAFGDVRGPITRIDAAGGALEVSGTPVRVDAGTVFDGVAGLSALAPGDEVEAHGLPAPFGAPIVATRLARVQAAAGGRAPIKLRGAATGIDLAARTCSVNGLPVSLAALDPAGLSLAEGEPVVVWAAAWPAAGPIVAMRLAASGPPLPPEGAATRIEGPVGTFGSLAAFRVGGVAVDASGPSVRFSGGEAAALGPGAKVEVTGVFRDGTLVAQEVSIEGVAGRGRTLEFTGPIESFVSPADFVVRGQRIDASGAEVRFSPGRLGPADLARGRQVEVRGTLAGQVLRAARVRFVD